MQLKVITVEVHVTRTRGDSTNNGVSSNQNILHVVDEIYGKMIEIDKKERVFELDSRFSNHLRLIPAFPQAHYPAFTGANGPMFGGNIAILQPYVGLSDTHPLQGKALFIHDRFEWKR